MIVVSTYHSCRFDKCFQLHRDIKINSAAGGNVRAVSMPGPCSQRNWPRIEQVPLRCRLRNLRKRRRPDRVMSFAFSIIRIWCCFVFKFEFRILSTDERDYNYSLFQNHCDCSAIKFHIYDAATVNYKIKSILVQNICGSCNRFKCRPTHNEDEHF